MDTALSVGGFASECLRFLSSWISGLTSSEIIELSIAFFTLCAALAAWKSALASKNALRADLTADVRVTMRPISEKVGETGRADPGHAQLKIENVGRSTVWVEGICRCWIANTRGDNPPPISAGLPPIGCYKENDLPIGPGGHLTAEARPDQIHPDQPDLVAMPKSAADRTIKIREFIEEGRLIWCYGFVALRGIDGRRSFRGYCLIDNHKGNGYIEAWPINNYKDFHYLSPRK